MGSESESLQRQHNWLRYLLALATGLVWAFAFPTFNIAGLAWLTPALILLVTLGSGPRKQFQLGYLSGLTFQLITLRWLLNIPVSFLPILGWLALSAFLALLPALWIRLTWFLCPETNPGVMPHEKGTSFPIPIWKEAAARLHSLTWSQRTLWTLGSACLWVAYEMIQTRIFSGFPWNLLATSQGSMLIFAQIAEFTGVYGLSFLMVVTSLSLFHAAYRLIQSPHQRFNWQREIAIPFLLLTLAAAFGWRQLQSAPTPTTHDTLKIALVQPSIPQTMIWNSNEDESRWKRLLELTQKAIAARPDLILWPEAATPFPIRLDPEAHRILASLLEKGNSWLAVGSDHAERIQNTDGGLVTNYYNSAFLLDPQGRLTTSYNKRHLVMFGEYVPFSQTFPFLRYLTPITGGFTPGTTPVPFRITDKNAEFGMLICFEDGFPHLVREHAQNVDFLVNITNDGWFGEGGAQWQHTASAQFRSIENRMPLVRCSNNGVSCHIDPQGRIHEILGSRTPAAYQEGLQIIQISLPQALSPMGPRLRSQTFYQRWGDLFGWGCTAMGALILVRRRGVKPAETPLSDPS